MWPKVYARGYKRLKFALKDGVRMGVNTLDIVVLNTVVSNVSRNVLP